MRGISTILRRLSNASPCSRAKFTSLSETLMMSAVASASYSSLVHSEPLSKSTIAANTGDMAAKAGYQPRQQLDFSRGFSTSSSSGASKFVLIESEEQFNDSLRKVQDESLPAIFYFTAAWCGPCRLLAPLLEQMCEKYPHVTTYKIDIDQEGLDGTLSNLHIHAVPTLHFFQNGKKASEVIGADAPALKDKMEKLYE